VIACGGKDMVVGGDFTKDGVPSVGLARNVKTF